MFKFKIKSQTRISQQTHYDTTDTTDITMYNFISLDRFRRIAFTRVS